MSHILASSRRTRGRQALRLRSQAIMTRAGLLVLGSPRRHAALVAWPSAAVADARASRWQLDSRESWPRPDRERAPATRSGGLRADERARFLESLVETMGDRSGAEGWSGRQERSGFQARLTALAGRRPDRHRGERIVIPCRAQEEVGALRLTRQLLHRDDVYVHRPGDFAARGARERQLLDDARVRRAERSRLSDQIITASRERRRLAKRAARRCGAVALCVASARCGVELDRGRSWRRGQQSIAARSSVIADDRQLRNLSFNLEPVFARPGFTPAVRALTDQIELAHNVGWSSTSRPPTACREDAGGEVPDHPRALDSGAPRPPQTLSVTMRETRTWRRDRSPPSSAASAGAASRELHGGAVSDATVRSRAWSPKASGAARGAPLVESLADDLVIAPASSRQASRRLDVESTGRCARARSDQSGRDGGVKPWSRKPARD